MTPRQLEAIEEFLERLLQRSESPHPLEPEEIDLVIHSMRELLDEVVALSVKLTDVARPSRKVHMLDRQRRALTHRCRDALTHLEHKRIDEAMAILRAALGFSPENPRTEGFPFRRDEANE